jgi:hypothetical protein
MRKVLILCARESRVRETLRNYALEPESVLNRSARTVLSADGKTLYTVRKQEQELRGLEFDHIAFDELQSLRGSVVNEVYALLKTRG